MFVNPSCHQFMPSKSGLKIMELIHGYFKQTGKPWAYIDQAWMLEKLEQWHGVKMARSTLNYNLKLLRDNGFIETTARHYRDPATNKFVCRVSLYKITKKLRQFFYKVATYFKRIGWVPSVKALKAGFIPVVGKVTTRHEAFTEICLARRRESG